MPALRHIQIGCLKVILGTAVTCALIFLCSATQQPVLADAVQIVDGVHYPDNQLTSGERCKISTLMEVSCWVGVSKWEETIPIKWGYYPVWIDNDNLLVGGFSAEEVSNSKGLVKTPVRYFIWNLLKGPQKIFEAKGWACAGSGNVVIFKDSGHGNNLLALDNSILAGKIGTLTLTSFREHAGIERTTDHRDNVKNFKWRKFDCSFVQLPEKHVEEDDKIYLLNKQHGYFVRRQSGNVDIVSPDFGPHLLTDTKAYPNSLSLSKISYFEFNQSYFLSAFIPSGDPLGPKGNQYWKSGETWKLFWYDPAKGLVIDQIPFGKWAEKLISGSSVYPWRFGFLLISGSSVGQGLYLFTEKGAENILPYSLGLAIQMSPNGCRAAIQTGVWGNHGKDWWKDPTNLGPKLFVFDLCSS